MKINLNRRSFLKSSGIAILGMAASQSIFSRLSYAEEKKDLPMAKETDPLPKQLKYCSNADKPNKNCEARKAKDKKDQYCNGCQLFTKVSGEGKDEKGKCMLMPAHMVSGKAWCMSWVKKP